MNLQQLKYIIAVDELRHFGKAAEKCHVTQPTLSMMIQKLEEELGATLFDRSKQPVIPTEIGNEIIAQARRVLKEVSDIPDLVHQYKGRITGEIRIGIIPTLAPYLLPLFIQSFLEDYPEVELIVTELLTERIEEKLKAGTIDVGILVTPLHNKSLKEHPLFYEKFFAYVADSHPLFDKTYILAEDIDVNQLWLLEEGHCFRSQIANLCELKKAHMRHASFKYEAGSIETLKKFVEHNSGITILPELTTLDMPPESRTMLRSFAKPEPVREVSLVTHRSFLKKRLIDVLKNEIMDTVPDEIMRRGRPERIVEIRKQPLVKPEEAL